MASPASPTRPSRVGASISRSPPASIPRPGSSTRPRRPAQNSSRPDSPTAAGPVADDQMGLAAHDDAWISGGWRVVSGAISGGREAGPQTEPRAAAEVGGSRGRGRWVAVGVMVVLAAGAVAGWRAGGVRRGGRGGVGGAGGRGGGGGGGGGFFCGCPAGGWAGDPPARHGRGD